MSDGFHIDPDIRKAETLPARFYRDATVFELMKEKVFLSSWQWMGDYDQIEFPGYVFPKTILEQYLSEPLLLVHTEDGKLRCMTNVCTHRGNLVVNEPGKAKNLVCMYHGRKFGLDGKFQSMPEFQEAEGFPRDCDSLHNFDLRRWGNWLFAKMGGDIPFDNVEEVLNERVGFLPLNDFYHDPGRDRSYLVNAHWALYCDNYLEGFHIPFVHKDLNTSLDYGEYNTEIFEYCNLQVGFGNDGTECFDFPDGHVDHGKNIAAYYFWIYPNLMLNFYPWGLSVNLVQPITIDRTRVSFLTYLFDESKIGASAGALLDKVEREDEFVVEGVHKGVKSRFYQAGRFSPRREKGVHHFHRLIADALNR